MRAVGFVLLIRRIFRGEVQIGALGGVLDGGRRGRGARLRLRGSGDGALKQFTNFGNVDEGGELSYGGVRRRAIAVDIYGLRVLEFFPETHIRAFGGDAIAVQAVEFFCGFGIVERIGSVLENFIFHALDADQTPGGIEEVFEEILFDDSDGIDCGEEPGAVTLVLFAFVLGDVERWGRESMGAGVLRGGGFAGLGFGSGGHLRVGAIGFDLRFSGHFGFS